MPVVPAESATPAAVMVPLDCVIELPVPAASENWEAAVLL
jgi:hypothetical protein